MNEYDERGNVERLHTTQFKLLMFITPHEAMMSLIYEVASVRDQSGMRRA